MRFKLDENLPVEATQILRAAGHDATSVVDQNLQGTSDAALDQICHAEDRVLVTPDLDFSGIRGYPPDPSPGRIVLRLGTQEKRHVLSVIQKLCVALEAENPASRLWIVEDERIRVRG